MRYAISASQMQKLDATTIHTIGVSSLVLMERAAHAVVQRIIKQAEQSDKIFIVCGCGNNGGDGFAIARMLHLAGYFVDVLLVGNIDKMTQDTKQQMQIVVNLGLSILRQTDLNEYNIIVDSIFGIGLNRTVTGEYADIIQKINEQKEHAFIVAVDIPSGISADNGQLFGCAIKADLTVTFQEMKMGLLLYPGAEYAGTVVVEEIGILPFTQDLNDEMAFRYYDDSDVIRLIPKRKAYSNKGTYGKVLVIAGSETITGAAYFSAYAAYRMGAGLVKILTAASALPVLRTLLPEALFDCYDGKDCDTVIEQSLKWADAVVLGPGLSQSQQANHVFEQVCTQMKQMDIPLVLDADGINILSEKINQKCISKEERFTYIKEVLPMNTILTPHLMELSRLTLDCVKKIPSILIDIAKYCPYNSELIYVLKDARTIVTSKNLRYINVTGNNGMATGGSGDVLTGIIAALLAGGLLREDAATLGVYLHGLAGDYARKKLGSYSMLARDIIEALPEVLMNYEGRSL